VDYLLILDREVTVCDVSDYMQRFKLAQFALLADVLLEVSAFTKLSHDVYIVFGHKDFNGSKDVGMR
jgi:hypothetical protein